MDEIFGSMMIGAGAAVLIIWRKPGHGPELLAAVVAAGLLIAGAIVATWGGK